MFFKFDVSHDVAIVRVEAITPLADHLRTLNDEPTIITLLIRYWNLGASAQKEIGCQNVGQSHRATSEPLQAWAEYNEHRSLVAQWILPHDTRESGIDLAGVRLSDSPSLETTQRGML